MPIAHEVLETGVLHTRLIGVVTDTELLDYYRQQMLRRFEAPWKEIVDGREITTYSITVDGQRALAVFIGGYTETLRGACVGMVAASEVAYGMFRMWQLQREGLGYKVAVFRDFDRAMEWVMSC